MATIHSNPLDEIEGTVEESGRHVRVRIMGELVPTGRWSCFVREPAAPLVTIKKATTAGQVVDKALKSAGILPGSGICSRRATTHFALCIDDAVIDDTEVVGKVISQGSVLAVRRLPTKPRCYNHNVAVFMFKLAQFLASMGFARYALQSVVDELKTRR